MSATKYRKDVGEVIRFAEEHGFKCEGMTGSGHWRLRHISGPLLIVPATPGGYRWRQNARSHIKRIHTAHKDVS